jgi:hypothetical protein
MWLRCAVYVGGREHKVKSEGIMQETFMLCGWEVVTLLEGSHAAPSRPSGGSNIKIYKEKDVRMGAAEP